MAIRHVATVLCDYLINADDGRATLVGVFRNIHARQFPALKDPMGVYIEFEGADGDPYEVVLTGPRGFLVPITSGTIEKPDTGKYDQWSANSAVVARPAVFPNAGVYRIVLKSENRVVHRHAFGVSLASTKEE